MHFTLGPRNYGVVPRYLILIFSYIILVYIKFYQCMLTVQFPCTHSSCEGPQWLVWTNKLLKINRVSLIYECHSILKVIHFYFIFTAGSCFVVRGSLHSGSSCLSLQSAKITSTGHSSQHLRGSWEAWLCVTAVLGDVLPASGLQGSVHRCGMYIFRQTLIQLK